MAARNGDRSEAGELFFDDVELFVPGENLLAGVYKGPGAMFDWYERAKELSGGTLKCILHDVVANDRHAFAVEHLMASRAGRNLDSRFVTIYHVIDGRIRGGTRHFTDVRRHDEFWS